MFVGSYETHKKANMKEEIFKINTIYVHKMFEISCCKSNNK